MRRLTATTDIKDIEDLADHLEEVGVDTDWGGSGDDEHLVTPNGTRIYWQAECDDPGWAYRDHGPARDSGCLEDLTPNSLR